MVAIKLFGIVIAFYFFVVREAFAQNFYPARYGKRDDNDFQREPLPEGKRLGRSDEQNTITDRKIRFFISGGRYGKRGCYAENCFKGSKEIISPGFENDQDQSDRINIPIRKNQFMTGSRFGKRLDRLALKDPASMKDPWCIFTRNKNNYRCLLKPESREEEQFQLFDSNFLNGI